MLDASLEAAYVAGLPEAVILYAHMALSDDHDRYSDLRPVIQETVRHMIHEGSADDLLPISIPLAEEIIKRSTS